MERPFHKHLDNEELNALVPSCSETEREMLGLSAEALLEAQRHVESCVPCRRKMSIYRQLLNGSRNGPVSQLAPPGDDCPEMSGAEWHEVAAGVWPEFKTKQLIMHAAVCDYCGPRLRASVSADTETNHNVMRISANLKPPSVSARGSRSQVRWGFMQWAIPVVALIVMAAGINTIRSSPSSPISGAKFAEFAVRAHRQHAQKRLVLDVRSDSLQALNEWFKVKSPFSLALPASPDAPGEERPYRLEGARMVQVDGKSAAFIAYQVSTPKLQPTAASLMVAPDSVAVASGGIEVDFKKVSFHYATVEGYKVVAWSVHGLTYALVSEEGNGTQRSCMVCHSAMRDRDLSQTPAPSFSSRETVEPFFRRPQDWAMNVLGRCRKVVRSMPADEGPSGGSSRL